jgi:hypothetical protein
MLLLNTDMSKEHQREAGLDVFDLAEFPIAVLGETASPGMGLLEFKDGDKSWQVAAHPKYGLPTAADVEVYVALLGVTRQHNPFQSIPFQRRPLLKQMGWGLDGRAYDRIDLALRRWRHTTLTGVRAVHDPKTGQWREEIAFGLLDSYRLCRRTDGSDAAQTDSFRWSSTIAELLAAGYQHELDVATYMQLKSPIAQAEFRYLSAKVRDGKHTFEQHLLTYAQQHIGLRQAYVSNIRQKLGGSHRQLMACGFLSGVEYGTMKSGPHRGEAKITLRMARRAALALPALAAPADPWVERLVEIGVTRAVAVDLVETHPARVEQQLQYWPHRPAIQSPGAALRCAIEEDWAAPEGWKRRPIRAKPARAAEPCHAAPLPENPKDPETAAFDAWWAERSETERAALTAQAQADLFAEGFTVRQHYERHPDRLPEALRPILIQLTGWKPEDSGP